MASKPVRFLFLKINQTSSRVASKLVQAHSRGMVCITKPQTLRVPCVDRALFYFSLKQQPDNSQPRTGSKDTVIQAGGHESIAFQTAFVKVSPALHTYLRYVHVQLKLWVPGCCNLLLHQKLMLMYCTRILLLLCSTPICLNFAFVCLLFLFFLLLCFSVRQNISFV